MSYVTKAGVAELRYLSETGTLEGEAVDLFLLQDQLPTSPDKQRAFLQKDPDTKTQVGCCRSRVDPLPYFKSQCLDPTIILSEVLCLFFPRYLLFHSMGGFFFNHIQY
jgi:hypothetical protein